MSDRYRLKRLFAQGGMAEVYLGVAVGEAGFEKPVAIKRVLPQLASDPRVVEMFLAEAKLAKFLSHQNVVQVLDVGRSDDGAYLVMELINGWDLETLSELAQNRGERFPPALAAFIAHQALTGLIHAYRRTQNGKPVMNAHRDVSGSNILISTEGEVKVTDFGIARVDGLGGAKTEPGTFKGKIAYAAPEVLRAEPATHQSDQFALGVVLFKMLCGRPPFSGSEQWATYYAALQEQRPQLDAHVPPGLAQIVSRMLEQDAGKRFETPEALSRALSGYLASSGAATSSHELAEFVLSLAPPPPAAEQLEGGAESVVPTFSLRSQPGAPPKALYEGELELQRDWKPSGAELDTSGAIHRSSRGPGGAAAALAKCLFCGGPLSSEDAPCSVCAAREALARQNEPLELAGDPRAHLSQETLPEPPSRTATAMRTLVKRLAVLAVLGVAGFAAYRFAWPKVEGTVGRTQGVAAVLRIDSEPSGAAILLDGQRIGTTPYFAENLYPEREIPVRVELKGYRPWTGTFSGGKNQQVRATLTKKK